MTYKKKREKKHYIYIVFLLKSFHFRRLQKPIGFFPIQILIFWTLQNNADARRCSYFELGLPVNALGIFAFRGMFHD